MTITGAWMKVGDIILIILRFLQKCTWVMSWCVISGVGVEL